MTDSTNTITFGIARPSAPRFDRGIQLIFLAYIVGACLIVTDLIDVNEPKWFLVRVVPVVLVAAWLLHDAWRGAGSFLQAGALGVLGVVFLAWHAVSASVALNAGRAWIEISELAGLICTFFIAARLSTNSACRDRMLWALALLGAVVSVYGIAQHFGADFLSWEEDNEVLVSRGVSFFGHATFTASVLIQLIPIAIGFALTRDGWPVRIFLAIACLSMLYHLSFTGARMATLSFLLTAVVTTLWIGFIQWRARRNKDARRISMRAVAAVIAVILIAIAGAGWFIARAWQAKQSDLFAIRQASFALRLYQWETASRVVAAHPVLGVGAGNYEIISPRYWNAVEQMRTARHGRWMQQAHNEYLQTAAELGLPGLAILLLLIAYGMAIALDGASRATDRNERWIGIALAASIMAIALDANITFSLQAPGSALLFWTVLGVVAGSYAQPANRHA